MPGAAPSCSCCAAPLASDQRYCLECGERHGPQRLDALALARGPGATRGEGAARGEGATRGERAASGGASVAAHVVAGQAALVVPGPRVAALLSLAMLVAGIALGVAGGPHAPTSQAATGRRFILIAGPPALGALPTPPASAVPAAPPASRPDLPVPASAPAAGASVPAPPAAAAVTPAPPAAAPAPQPPASPPSAPSTPDTTPAPAPTPIPAAAPVLPPVKHVWIIALADRKLAETFGPASPDPWFRDVLVRRGVLLNNFHATSPGTLAAGVALLSGQGANPATEGDCAPPTDIAPGTISGDLQQIQGTGCVYPGTVATLPEQLVGSGRRWKAYFEDVAPGKLSTAAGCEATRTPRNPFAYFKALTADGQCPQRILGTDALAGDLADPAATPELSYIVPNACHDGRDAACVPGAPAGLAAASPWLQGVLSEIESSQAYREDGLVVLLADRSGPDGPAADTSARKGADAPAGGGLVPALLLSKWVTPGQQVAAGYDQFSLLRSLEDLFGVTRLGQAGAPGLKGFGPRVFGGYTPPAG